jgi:hypothetical protein
MRKASHLAQVKEKPSCFGVRLTTSLRQIRLSYFTETGWEQVGKTVAANAQREGRVVKVIRRKNPEASQIVYQDALQVAIIPIKHKTKR